MNPISVIFDVGDGKEHSLRLFYLPQVGHKLNWSTLGIVGTVTNVVWNQTNGVTMTVENLG